MSEPVTIPVPVELLTSIVEYIEKSAELVEEAGNIEKSASVSKEALSKQLPAVVDTLIKAGMLESEQRAQAIDKLQDPMKILDSLNKVASAYKVAPKAPEKTETLGAGTEIKVAAVATSGSKKESDAIWERAFG